MLVAATVTSGCHTSDVASDSGSGSNTALTNGALWQPSRLCSPFSGSKWSHILYTFVLQSSLAHAF